MINKKVYVGSTISIENYNNIYSKASFLRLKKHIGRAIRQDNDCPIFYNELRKYPLKNWLLCVVDIVENKKRNEREEFFIDYYSSYNIEYGYNIERHVSGKESKILNISTNTTPTNIVNNSTTTNASKKTSETTNSSNITNLSRAAISNVIRCQSGALKRNELTKKLPPNMNYRYVEKSNPKIPRAIFAQKKIPGTDKTCNSIFSFKDFGTEENCIKLAAYFLNDLTQNPDKHINGEKFKVTDKILEELDITL